MTSTGRWILESVTIRGVLAFPEQTTMRFEPGVQVIEAPNHSGKTSLALALLWALTGQVPSLPRIDKTSFRLFNRSTGADGVAVVTVTLRSGSTLMTIRRTYQARGKGNESLELDIGPNALSGDEAQRRIDDELGVSAGSMEGCGVVLQDYRLKLITDGDKAVGAVVNEMLGLGTLSDIVPCLRERAADAEHTAKTIQAFLEGGDPLRQWEQQQARLSGELQKRETSALTAGYSAPDLEDPAGRIAIELNEVAASLGVAAPAQRKDAEREIERLRADLKQLRQSSPETVELAKIQRKLTTCKESLRELTAVASAWAEHDEAVTIEQSAGTVDLAEVSAAIAAAEGTLTKNAERRNELKEEEDFLASAYSHLQVHTNDDKCPVCGNSISATKLRQQVRRRLDASIATELESLGAKDDQAKKDKRHHDARLRKLKELYGDHEKLVARARACAQDSDATALEGALSKIDSLWRIPKQRAHVGSLLQDALRSSEAERDRVQSQADKAEEKISRREAELFHPAESRLNRLRERLLPVADIGRELNEHLKSRSEAADRSSDLSALVQEAQQLALQLKRIAKAVSEVELNTATDAVQRRLPIISKLFADIAQNPDYTGLEMESDISRETVRYRLRATSSRSASLADAVGHVLSGGDLSAASVALLIGLASGDAHSLGFLLLDDPAEQMDDALQKRLAKELASALPNRQLIVLTHQRSFADALAGHGVKRRALLASRSAG